MAINRVDITVLTIAALAEVLVSELDDGANAWVTGSDSYFVLRKSSLVVPDGINSIAPIAGSPIAGNAGAVWIKILDPFGNQSFFLRKAADATTNSVAFVDLLSLSFIKEVAGNMLVLATWAGSVANASGNPPSDPFGDFRLLIDGVAQDAAPFGWFPAALNIEGTIAMSGGISIQALGTALAAGSHTIKFQWKVRNATVTLSTAVSEGESASIAAMSVG